MLKFWIVSFFFEKFPFRVRDFRGRAFLALKKGMLQVLRCYLLLPAKKQKEIENI